MKHRLRHPIRTIREPFGKAGLTVAICALVLAMVGGAYAAGGLTKSQEKQVKKIAQKYAGKPGAPGANGANGVPGAKGENGAAGAAGPPGENVTVKALAKNEEGCKEGGAKFSNGTGTAKACNGEKGPQGPEGNIQATLPSGKTETGAWSVSYLEGEGLATVDFVPISFNIPLEEELDGSHVHFLESGAAATTECPGTVDKPEAVAGNLCIYEATLPGFLAPFQVAAPENGIRDPTSAIQGAGTTGAVMMFGESNNGKFGMGTWAVTAE